MCSACCRSIESEVVGVADTEKKRSQQMVREESAYMAPAARIPYYDLVIDHGEGAMLYDVDGNSYVDLLASASATNVGHCHPRVVKAITDQAQRLIHYTPAYVYHTPEMELVEKLCEIAPGDTPKKVVFGNSGLRRQRRYHGILPAPTRVARTWSASRARTTAPPTDL